MSPHEPHDHGQSDPPASLAPSAGRWPAEPDHLSEFLDINGVCTWLGISDKTLRAWREKRGFPTIVVDGWIAFSRD